jgi:tRNA-Thr(GGU) m(6)t(6)A37 methyltransferase TsaA
MAEDTYIVRPIGRVHSTLERRGDAPRQGWESGIEARVEIFPEFLEALHRVEAGQELVIVTWLHQARRDVLQVHPQGDQRIPLTGVFATRSPDRPNPVGLHRVKVLRIENGCTLHVRGLEAIDGTPVADIKAVLDRVRDC